MVDPEDFLVLTDCICLMDANSSCIDCGYKNCPQRELSEESGD